MTIQALLLKILVASVAAPLLIVSVEARGHHSHHHRTSSHGHSRTVHHAIWDHHHHNFLASAPKQWKDPPNDGDGEDGTAIFNWLHQLEHQYFQDCKLEALADTPPSGFYGAFLQPCEFQFRQVLKEDEEEGIADAATASPCSVTASKLVSSPRAMHWFFNLTDHFQKDEWTVDDIPSKEELLLWPDRCVGVMPKCYAMDKMPEAMHLTLSRIFSSGYPSEATHVQVDCRGDAAHLSRVAYNFAGGLQQTATSFIGWMVTVILLSIVLGMWSIYACLRLCLVSRRQRQRDAAAIYPDYGRDPVTTIDDSETEHCAAAVGMEVGSTGSDTNRRTRGGKNESHSLLRQRNH